MAIASGKIVRLYVENVAILYATECKVSWAQEVVKISHKDIDPGIDTPGFEEGTPGKKSIKASGQAFYGEEVAGSYDTLTDAIIEGSIVTVKMTGNKTGNLVTTFEAIVTSIEQTAPVDGKATYSVSFEGVSTPVKTRVA